MHICPICIDELHNTSSNCPLGCGHNFHYSCLIRWEKNNCPVCRTPYNNIVDTAFKPLFHKEITEAPRLILEVSTSPEIQPSREIYNDSYYSFSMYYNNIRPPVHHSKVANRKNKSPKIPKILSTSQ